TCRAGPRSSRIADRPGERVRAMDSARGATHKVGMGGWNAAARSSVSWPRTTASASCEPVPRAWIERALAESGVQRTSTPFAGSSLYAVDEQPRPALVFLHGSEGGHAGFLDIEAIHYAAQGFAVLPLCYFGPVSGLPRHLVDIEITRTYGAVQW